jgi:zinc/manganese transport system ATP-binding protein
MIIIINMNTATAHRLRGVSAEYDGQLALNNIDLDLPGGTMTVLSGANGSGKSTLLGVLAGTQPVSRGTVERHDQPSIAFVVQQSAVSARLPLTVQETVTMGRWRVRGVVGRLRRADRAIVDESLEALGIADLARRSLFALSGGQRQRALVAQGLAQRADLLLLDEPTAGTDALAQQLIERAIETELARGATIVQATHDPAVLAAAERVVLLESGRRL